MRRFYPLVLLSILAASCAVPARDNPYDNEAPRPVVHVSTEVGGAWVEGRVARRNTRFRFDASGSFDPEGRAMVFRWDFDHDPATFEFPPDADSAMVAEVAPELSLADLPAGGAGVGIRGVRLRIRAGKSEAVLEIPISITNDPPALDPGEEIVVPVLETPTVTLDPCGAAVVCTTRDPDGDVVRNFVWTQIAGPPVALALTGTTGRATFTAPADERVLAFRLEATDGLAVSRAHQVVRVGPQAWAQTAGHIHRLHPELEVAVNPFATESLRIVAGEPETGELWTASDRLDGSIEVRRLSRDAFASLDLWTVPGGDPVALVPDGTGAIVASNTGFRRLLAGGTSVDLPVNGEGPLGAAAGGWLLTNEALYRDTGSGPVLVAAIPDSEPPAFAGGSLIIDSAGIPWIGYSRLTETNIFRLAGTTLEEIFNTGSGAEVALAPHPDGGVFIAESDFQDLLAGTISPAGEYRLLGVLPNTQTSHVASEIATRSLWVATGRDLVRFVVHAGGDVEVLADFETEKELGVPATDELVIDALGTDARGASVLLAGTSKAGDHYLARVPAGRTRARIVPGAYPETSLNQHGRIAADKNRGGLWYMEPRPVGLAGRHLTAGGRELADGAFSDEDFGGSAPALLGVFAAADGGATAAFYSQFGNAPAGIASVDPAGGGFRSVDFSPQRIHPLAAAGNPLAICLVGHNGNFTGAPLHVAVATGTKTVGALSPPWDPFHVTHAAVSADGSTCWFAEQEAAPQIVTATSAGTATRTAVTQQTTALAGDPRPNGGAWRARTDGLISRFTGGAVSFSAIATPVTALAIERVCDNPATAACANVWYAVPGTVVRARSDGVVLQTFPLQGSANDLAVQ